LARPSVRASTKQRCVRFGGVPRFVSCVAEFARIVWTRLLPTWTGWPARGKRFLAGLGFSTLLLFGAAPVRAHDKLECVRAHERAQELQRTGDLRGRLEQLAICASTTCPTLVQDDCRAWSSQAETAPRKLEAPTSDGTDSTTSSPAAPGEPEIAPFGTGPSNPDAVARGQQAGGPPVGPVERGERVDVDNDQHGAQLQAEVSSRQQGGRSGNRLGLSASAGAGGGTASDAFGRDSPLFARTHARPRRTWVAPLLLGSAAGLALAAGAYLGLSGRSSASDLRDTCAPACSPSEVSAVRTRLLVADLTMLAGALCAGATAWLLWDRSAAHATPSSQSPSPSSASFSSAFPSASLSSSDVRLQYVGHF